MIFFLVGKDAVMRRKKADALLAAFVKKNPGAPIYTFSPEDWSAPRFLELASTRSFFDDTHAILVRDIISHKEYRDELFACSEAIVESSHSLFFIDDSHDKEAKSWVKKITEAQVFEFDLPKKTGSDFDPFSLGNAVVARDKKQAWVLLQTALRKDVAPEELFGPLLWKVKDLLVKQGKNRAYSHEELAALSQQLIAAFHDSHRGGIALDLALERVMLSL